MTLKRTYVEEIDSLLFRCDRCEFIWSRNPGSFTESPVPCPNCDPCPVCKVRVADHTHDERKNT